MDENFKMPLTWKDLVVLGSNEYIMYSTEATESGFFQAVSINGVLVFTNKRLIWIVTKIYPPFLGWENSFSDFEKFSTAKKSLDTGFLAPKKMMYELIGELRKGQEKGDFYYYQYRFSFKDESALEEAFREANKCLTLYEKENEEILNSQKIEVIHKGYVGIVNFDFISESLKNKGLMLEVIECPNCGGKIKMPDKGNISKCEHCGKEIYSIDIFEKFKTLIEK